ncbi:DsbA family oxidoreductase [Pseudonocardia sp. CA-107938]|uniref:DsbA family oxidoreductase n=1 Tax=Pseudonocardia sp. CA-107938 TaxID=3240021 RepID=UPI003D913EDB
MNHSRVNGSVWVEIYADVLCPWSFIGKRRLDTALSGLAARARVAVRWRSVELDPHLGRVPGRTAAEEMADPAWWGDQAASRIAHIQALGAAEGLTLNLHLARPVNSFDAHRLLQFAADHGRADAMAEHLLLAYHTDGADIADPHVLRHLGVQVGLPATEVAALVAGDAYAAHVRADERRAAEQGATSVPSLVVDGRGPISGIQPPHVLHRLLTDATPER